MSLLPQPTDLQLVDKGILDVAEAISNLNSKLKTANDAVYALPDDRLLAVLNADITRTQTITALKTELGTKANDLLDLIDARNADGSPKFSNRAPVGLGRDDLEFDGTAFSITPPVEEPLPE